MCAAGNAFTKPAAMHSNLKKKIIEEETLERRWWRPTGPVGGQIGRRYKCRVGDETNYKLQITNYELEEHSQFVIRNS